MGSYVVGTYEGVADGCAVVGVYVVGAWDNVGDSVGFGEGAVFMTSTSLTVSVSIAAAHATGSACALENAEDCSLRLLPEHTSEICVCNLPFVACFLLRLTNEVLYSSDLFCASLTVAPCATT